MLCVFLSPGNPLTRAFLLVRDMRNEMNHMWVNVVWTSYASSTKDETWKYCIFIFIWWELDICVSKLKTGPLEPIQQVWHQLYHFSSKRIEEVNRERGDKRKKKDKQGKRKEKGQEKGQKIKAFVNSAFNLP